MVARPGHRRMLAPPARAPRRFRCRAAFCRGLLAAACLALGLAGTVCGGGGSGGKRVIVLGIDGLDYGLLERFMAEGEAPTDQEG